MKRLTIILLTLLSAVALSSCVKEDPKEKAINTYVKTQSTYGLYRDNSVLFSYNTYDCQWYFNKSTRTFRIMNNDASKYAQFILSAAPVKGKSVDVAFTSYGYGLPSAVAYKSMKVTKMEDGLCWLYGGEGSSYTGIIIGWID